MSPLLTLMSLTPQQAEQQQQATQGAQQMAQPTAQGAQQVLKHTKMQRRTMTPGIRTHLMIKMIKAVIIGVKAQ